MGFLEKVEQEFKDYEKDISLPQLKKIISSGKEGFLATGFPTNKFEEYKYTNLKKLLGSLDLKWGNSDTSALVYDKIKPSLLPVDAYKVILINGVYNAEFSDSIEEKNVFVGTIAEYCEKYPSQAEEFISKKGKDDPLSDLNDAYSSHGLAIHLGKSAILDKPVAIYHVVDTESGMKHVQPKTWIYGSENAQGKIIEKADTIGDHEGFINLKTDIIGLQNALIDYIKVQNDTDKSFHVEHTNVYQKTGAICKTYTYSFAGKLIRNNLNFYLEEEHTEAHMYGLYLLSGNDHVDNHTSVDHMKANCFSNELYKGIIDDKATGVFNGKIFVRQDAQKTNAFQSNNNLLLSDNATINTKPQLEIWADDVSCSHGATTGQLDEEGLFYLRSRGIPEKKAKGLLLNAFANEVVQALPVVDLKDYLQEQLIQKLT